MNLVTISGCTHISLNISDQKICIHSNITYNGIIQTLFFVTVFIFYLFVFNFLPIMDEALV